MFYALAFFEQMIVTHAGDRLIEAAGDVESITEPVAYTVPIDPMPFLTSTHFKFPLLAVYRKNGRLEDRTVAWRHDVTTFELLYLLPPLTAADAEQVVPVLTAIRDILDDRAELGFDPTFNPLGAPPNDAFWVDLAGIEKMTFTESEWGVIPLNEGLTYFGLRMRGTVSERSDTPNTGFEQFAGTDATIALGTPDDTDVDLSITSTKQPPTIASINVPSGTYAGGVTVTVTGTLFAAPARVMLGNRLGNSVTVVNATTITFVTPSFDQALVGSTLDVTVQTDFGEAVLPATYTLT